MNLQKFVFLGDNQQLTTLLQLLVIPKEERTVDQLVIISWYFKNELNTSITRKEAEEMNIEKFDNIKNNSYII